MVVECYHGPGAVEVQWLNCILVNLNILHLIPESNFWPLPLLWIPISSYLPVLMDSTFPFSIVYFCFSISSLGAHCLLPFLYKSLSRVFFLGFLHAALRIFSSCTIQSCHFCPETDSRSLANQSKYVLLGLPLNFSTVQPILHKSVFCFIPTMHCSHFPKYPVVPSFCSFPYVVSYVWNILLLCISPCQNPNNPANPLKL